MLSRTLKILKLGALVLGVSLVTVLAVRAYDAHRAPDLQPWHTFVPDELSRKELAKADWNAYLAAEEAVFAQVREQVTERLEPEDETPSNRYFEGSPIYPGRFETDWNRSYILEPAGRPTGAVVFLHGLTDSPYSLRHLARRYRDLGFVAVAPRMPAHGTVPAALTEVEWEDWSEATRLAVREARRRAGPDVPLHIVGFSNGGALAMKYALDAIGDERLEQADRIVLIAPMIGITSFARFAGVFGWPAVLPAFAKAAWLGVVPEFNPFKYNSFPINGARQSSLLTRALQQRLNEYAREGRLDELPPVQTFQSVVDFTVSTRAIVTALYANLPANGSELVLFDFNRSGELGLLIRPGMNTLLTRILPNPPRNFRTTVITNASPGSDEVVERVTEAGSTAEQVRPLGLRYPFGVYSLSHLALTFPVTDSLYGMQPDDSENFGVNLGTLAIRGERGLLIVSQDSLTRIASNPFFPYLLERIEEGIGHRPEPPDEAVAQRLGAPVGATEMGSTR
jgi:alpha-beta hydrolase superfamily lysophospholipase